MTGRICAVAALLLGLIGCSTGDFVLNYFSQSGTDADQRVVHASLATVTPTAQGVLREMSIAATVSEQGERTVMNCVTPKGGRFTLQLSKVPDPEGNERTHVDVQWESQPEEATAIRLMAGLRVLSSRK
jgi:hypothetical protein